MDKPCPNAPKLTDEETSLLCRLITFEADNDGIRDLKERTPAPEGLSPLLW